MPSMSMDPSEAANLDDPENFWESHTEAWKKQDTTLSPAETIACPPRE